MLGFAALAACDTPKPFRHEVREEHRRNLAAPPRETADLLVLPPEGAPEPFGSRLAAALAVALRFHGVAADVSRTAPGATLQSTAGAREGKHGLDLEFVWKVSGGGPTANAVVVRHETTSRVDDYASGNDRLVSRIALAAAGRLAEQLGHAAEVAANRRALMAGAAPPQLPGVSAQQVAEADKRLSPLATSTPIAANASSTPAPAPGVRFDQAGKPVPAGAAPPPGSATPAATALAASPQAAAAVGAPRVRVVAVKGAPSDGNKTLTEGMRRALGTSQVVIADKADDRTFSVAGEVTLTPEGQRERLSIRWVLRDPKGKEVGDLEQTNLIPAGALDKTWGRLSEIVTLAASEGVLELLQAAGAKK